MQRQPGFEPQRVARAEPRRRDAGVEQRAASTATARGRGHVELDAVLAGVAGARDPARARRRTRAARTANRAHRRRASGATAAEQLARLGPLHREHRARRGDVVDLALAPAVEDGRLAERVDERLRCSTRSASRGSRSGATHHTMMSSTTCASSGSSRCVYCARPGPMRSRSLVSAHCSAANAPAPVHAHRAEVRHVEHDRVLAARAVLLEHAACTGSASPSRRTRAIRAPSARCSASSGLCRSGHAQADSAARRAASSVDGAAPPARGRSGSGAASAERRRSTSCDGGSSPYFTSRCR